MRRGNGGLTLDDRHALRLLALGAALGAILGIVVARTYVVNVKEILPPDALAVVNGKRISADEYESALALVANDKRGAVTEEDRLLVLDRLIEEELLVQGGIVLGLVETNPAVRKVITQAMLDSIMAESVSEQPSEEELRVFYQEHLATFVSLNEGPTRAGQPPSRAPQFEEVRAQVEARYAQQARDAALHEYLHWLRDEAKIVLAWEVGE